MSNLNGTAKAQETKRNNQLREAFEKVKTEYPDSILGRVFIWGFEGKSRLTWDQLQEVAKRHDIDKKHLPSKLSARRAFKRAIAELRKIHGTRANSDPGRATYTFVQMEDTDEKGTVVAFKKAEVSDAIQAELDAATSEAEIQRIVRWRLREIGYTYFSIDKKEDAVSSGPSELQQEFVDLYSKYGGHYQIKDIRNVLVSIVRRVCRGYKMRSGGGAWYVREALAGDLEKGIEFVTELSNAAGIDFTPYDMPLVKAEGSLKAASDSTEAGINDILEEANTQIKLIEERLAAGTKVGAGTVDKHAGGLQDLEEEIELASQFLGFGIEDLEATRKSLLERLTDVRKSIDDADKAELIEIETIA